MLYLLMERYKNGSYSLCKAGGKAFLLTGRKKGMRKNILLAGVIFVLLCTSGFLLTPAAAQGGYHTYTGYIREVQADNGYMIGSPLRFYLYTTPTGTSFVGYVGRNYDEQSEYLKFNNILYLAFNTGSKVTVTASGIYKGCFTNVSSIRIEGGDSYGSRSESKIDALQTLSNTMMNYVTNINRTVALIYQKIMKWYR
jgi:hypothetical protein